MTEPVRPCLLLVDDDELVLSALARLLRSLRRPMLTAATGDAAGEQLVGNEVGVIVCEPRVPALAGFVIEARHRHPAVVRIILTGYTGMSSVIDTVNEAQPFKLLTKPWLENELRATVKLAFEQYGINRKRERLIEEYAGIRSSAEQAHAYHVLGALLHSMHSRMTPEAIGDLPVGAVLIKDGKLQQINPVAQRFLASHDLPPVATGHRIAEYPPVIARLVETALGSPRRERLSLRMPAPMQGRLDFVTEELLAGLLVAFAARPQGGRLQP